MAQPKTTLYVGASARAPPEPARGSPIAIDRTTRRGDPTGRSLLPPSRPSSASPSRRTTDPAPLPSPLAPGGLDEQVTEAVLHAAFVPFGDLKDVNIPLDHQTQKNRGFGFVTFVEKCAPNDLTRFPLQPPRAVILRLARPSFLRSRARSTDLSIDRHPLVRNETPRDRAFSDLTSAPDARRAFGSQGGRRGGHVQHAQRRTLRARASV